MVGQKEWRFCEFPTGPDEGGGKVMRRHRMAVLEAPSMDAQVGRKKIKDREMPFLPVSIEVLSSDRIGLDPENSTSTLLLLFEGPSYRLIPCWPRNG